LHVFCLFAMVVLRVAVFAAAGALRGAQALPPITVQYEHGLPPAGRIVASNDFNTRAAHLADRVVRAEAQLAMSGFAAPANFLSDPDLVSPSFVHLSTRFEDVPVASLQAAFRKAMADSLRAEGLPLAEAQCPHDYTAPCPLGWVDLGDGGSCAAPVSYDGPCGGELSFKGLAAHEKMQLTDLCGVAFACIGGCTADYTQPCPDSWVIDAAGSCRAPTSYEGPCVGDQDFSQYASADKAVFENVCGVRWPCRRARSKSQRPSGSQACMSDFTARCPQGWSSHGGLCVAPNSYAGPCAMAAAMHGYSAEEKHVVAEQCDSPWPCKV